MIFGVIIAAPRLRVFGRVDKKGFALAAMFFAAAFSAVAQQDDVSTTQQRANQDLSQQGNSDLLITPEQVARSYAAHAHPFINDPLTQLVKRIPELKKIQPAADQDALPAILKKAGDNVDSHLSNIVDLIAREEITLQRSSGKGFSTPLRVEDNYLILKKPYEAGYELVEYRMDAAGHRLDNIGLNLGFLATHGFAMLPNFLASAFQRESVFRYLGDQKVGSADAYVVGFAQRPELATQLVNLHGRNGLNYPMLIQGVAWIDKRNFQIVRMRTDLLGPRPDLALDRQTTEVTFSEVHLADVPAALWLLKDVKVYMDLQERDSVNGRRTYDRGFRNEHHYSNYRLYRVSVKMLPGR